MAGMLHWPAPERRESLGGLRNSGRTDLCRTFLRTYTALSRLCMGPPVGRANPVVGRPQVAPKSGIRFLVIASLNSTDFISANFTQFSDSDFTQFSDSDFTQFSDSDFTQFSDSDFSGLSNKIHTTETKRFRVSVV
jgi:uncharacterized protein YjbI with pentapeptide repeats